jgi:hypothetical protein
MVAGMALDEGIVAAPNIHPLYLTNSTIKLPMTTPYPGPQSVLIMDNARIHHSPEIDDLIRGYGKLFSYCYLALIG